MESFSDPQQQLHAAERAEASPWVDYPPTPAWYPPLAGLWFALLALGFDLLLSVWGVACFVVAIGLEVVFMRWYRRYRGTMPSGSMPEELRRPVVVLLGLLAAVAATAGLLIGFAPVGTAPVVTFLLVTLLIAWYERAYDRAMAAARARLA